MDDREIVNLYWQRDSNAIAETASKYGNFCKSIAQNILDNHEDAEECVNDTYLKTWNAIPPRRPDILSAFLGKITRNLSFDRFRHKHAQKRGSGEIELVLDELGECVSGADSTVQEVEKKELIREINRFLDTLPKEKCHLFLCRYWYAFPLTKIAKQFDMTESHVSVTLHRIRNKMKDYLTERGYSL